MRRALKISCGAFAVLLALGVSLVGGLYIAGNTQSGRGMIEMLTSRLTSGHVKLSGLAGSFPKHLFIERLELRDERGTWLLAERVNLDWSPFAYIARGLQVNRLQVARLNMQRLPESSKPRDKVPVSIPRIDVGGISVDLLELGRVEQIQAVNKMIAQQLVADHEQAGEGQRRRRGIPHRQACADRLHNSW